MERVNKLETFLNDIDDEEKGELEEGEINEFVSDLKNNIKDLFNIDKTPEIAVG